MNTPYTLVAKIWDKSMTISGLKRGLVSFVKRLNIFPTQAPLQILDLGCGTGITTIALAEKYPHATIVASDVDVIMLEQTQQVLKKYPEALRNRIILAKADINDLQNITDFKSNERISKTYDFIIASAVLEHADSLRSSLVNVYKLLNSDGQFLAINMINSPVGKIYSNIYDFNLIPVNVFESLSKAVGFKTLQKLPLTISEFPTNYTRFGFLIKK